MKAIKANTATELESFLRILAEESVKKSKRTLESVDPEQKYFVDKIQQDSQIFLEDEAEEVSVDVDIPDTEAGSESDISFINLRDELNTIRSGRSLRDKETRQQLEQYFNDLDINEKETLVVFLKSIAGIMTDVLSSQNAPDPSDPPTSVKMSKKGEPTSPPSSAKKAGPRSPKKSEREPADMPPVQVGSPQVTESLRKKVRELMRSY